MPDYTKVNLRQEVEDSAQRFGLEGMEARFAKGELGVGVSYQKLAPDFRLPFGHRHERQEELYIVLGGGGRAKLEDDLVELEQWDALRVPPQVRRGFESGPEGLELLALNPAPPEGDVEQLPNWWSD